MKTILYNASTFIGLAFLLDLFKTIKECLNSNRNEPFSLSKKEVLFISDKSKVGLLHLIFPAVLLVITLTCGRVTDVILNVHNLEYEPDGTYCYYVKVSNGKNEYVLPAEITVYTVTDTDENDHRYSWTEYYIEKVYFSNGGYLTFEDSNEVKINKTISLTDTKDRDWDCTLLNKHAYSPNVKETDRLSASAIIAFVIGVVGNLYMLFLYISVVSDNIKNRPKNEDVYY